MQVKFGQLNKWEMTIKMDEIIQGRLKMTHIKKIFKLMIKNLSSEEIEKVQNYLNSSSKKYAVVFKEINQKGR